MHDNKVLFDEIEKAMITPALDLFAVGARRIYHRHTLGRLDISFISHWTNQRYAVVIETPNIENPKMLVISVETRNGRKRKCLGGFYSATDSQMLMDSSGWISARVLKHMGWTFDWDIESRRIKSMYPKGLYNK